MTEDKVTENLLEELNVFYENCPYHSDEYTKKIFKNNFKYDISDKYEFSRIASGSIAQVYKIKDIRNNKEYAMKVVHPDVRKQIKISKNILSFLLFINNNKLRIWVVLLNLFVYIIILNILLPTYIDVFISLWKASCCFHHHRFLINQY